VSTEGRTGPRRRGLWLGLVLGAALLVLAVRLALHREVTERPAVNVRPESPPPFSALELPRPVEPPVVPIAAEPNPPETGIPPALGAIESEQRTVNVRVTDQFGQALEGAQVCAWTASREAPELLPPPGSEAAFTRRTSAHGGAEWAETCWRQLRWSDPTWSPCALTAVTDSSGRAQLSLPAGMVAIEASKAGAGTSLCWTGDSGPPVTLELQPTRLVSGTVLAASGEPVADAIVHSWSYWSSHSALRARRPLPQRTDAHGRFAFEVTDPAFLHCWAFADGDWTVVGRSGASNLDLQVELRFFGRYALQGRVLRPDDGPAAGVQVDADAPGGLDHESGQSRSGNDGRFRIDVARPGPWVLVARSPGLISKIAAQPTLDERSPVAEVALTLVATATISGRVTWDSGEPASGFEVRAVPHRTKSGGGNDDRIDFITGTPTATCDADGRFVASGLHPELVYSLSASRTEDAAQDSVKAPSGATDVELVVRRADAGRDALRGRVVDGASGEPIRAFELRFNTLWYLGLNSDARTLLVEAADGRFVVEDRPRQAHWLEVRAEGYPITTFGPYTPGEPFEVRLPDLSEYVQSLAAEAVAGPH